jgi:hypothetical protein
VGRGSPLRPCRRAAEMVPRGALVLGELRAAPVRSGWAGAPGAPQRGRGTGGKVVRKRGRGMKICRVKYYCTSIFGRFWTQKGPPGTVDRQYPYCTRRCRGPWNHLEHEDTHHLRTTTIFSHCFLAKQAHEGFKNEKETFVCIYVLIVLLKLIKVEFSLD